MPPIRPGKIGTIAPGTVITAPSVSAAFSIFTPSAAYLAANAGRRTLVLFLEVDGDSTRYGTHDLGFPDFEAWLTNPLPTLSWSVDPMEGSSTVPIVDIHVLNRSGQITAKINSWIGKTAAIRAGFDGLDEAEFISFPVGEITQASQAGPLRWRISAQNVLHRANREAFGVSSTTLSADITATQTTIPTTNAIFFSGGTGYAQHGTEWLRYGQNDGTSLKNVTRGVFGTRPAAGFAGATIREGLLYRGHPALIPYEMLTAGGKRGVGMPPELIDGDSFDRLAETLGLTLVGEFLATQSQNALRLFEDQFLSRYTSYFVTDEVGRLSVQDYRNPTTAETIAELRHDTNIIAVGDASVEPRTIINSVSFSYDPDPLTGANRAETPEYVDAASIDIHERQHKTFSVKWARDDLPGVGLFFETHARRILRRYAHGLMTLPARLHITEHLRIPGEIVRVTHPTIPDIVGGTDGATEEFFEIIERSVVFPSIDLAGGVSGGYVDVKLASTGIVGLTTVISDLSIEQGAATAEQEERYAWIGTGDTIGL